MEEKNTENLMNVLLSAGKEGLSAYADAYLSDAVTDFPRYMDALIARSGGSR